MALGLVWAVLAALVATFILGMLWYGPLFGKPWMRAMGWENLSETEMKAMQKSAMPGYMTSLATAALATIVLWLLYGWAQAGATYSGPMLGAALGLAVWAAGYFPGTLTGRFFEGKSWALWGIGAGYFAVSALAQGVAVGYFHP